MSNAPDTGRPVVRRSRRVSLRVPLLVSGAEPAPFDEPTATLAVNANGALLTLGAPVRVGLRVRMRNRATQEEEECRVAWVGPPLEGKKRVGVAFLRPSPHFWKMDFPPVRND